MRLSGWSVPIEYLSASALSQFVGCPEQFRLRRLKRIPETKGVDAFIGACDHEVHADNLTRKIRTGIDLPTETMHGLYDAIWDAEIVQSGEPDWFESDPDATREHGHKMVETFHEVVSPTITPLAVEARFEETFKGVPIPVVGYVDVEERERLIERKTTKTRVSKPKPGWILQGRIYSAAFAKPVEWQVITKAKTPTICMPETDPELRLETGNVDGTALFIEQAAYMMNDFYVRYGPDNPWPTLGLLSIFQCSYCFAGPRYSNRCVAWGGDAYKEALGNEKNNNQIA